MKTPKKFRVTPNSVCPICGKLFYAEPNRIRKTQNGVVYCSIECSHKSGRLGRKKLAKPLVCKNCGNTYEVKNHRFHDGSNPQFCSQKCHGEHTNREAIARNTRVCAHCGREFHRVSTSLRKTEEITGGKVYCSSVCSYAANGSRGKNRLEIDFHEVFPELAYTGDGSWVLHDDLGGMNPDFILPKTNKVVELFGNYWHASDKPELRVERLRSLGFDAIVVWEDDFRKHKDETVNRVREFLSERTVPSR